MPYPEHLVSPMRQELTRLGVDELRTVEQVASAFDMPPDQTMLLVVNSVCGCAAAMARPAVGLALQNETQPDRVVTVFAGQDLEATASARDFLVGIPPSSPFMALIKGGEVVYVVERRHIEGRSAEAIAMDLVQAFDRFCGTDETAENGPESPDTVGSYAESPISSSFRSIIR
ncbi:MAG: BrxA/BrxB family bacilliredoxin [Rhodothermaceae bacterium]|nr:BrxA/BrxB family bacilliredoxin [Rhodothermaceae bacterium]MXW33452.1 BrxA/BrxB family bacilliredoxin [Rhodothermaceae bacterium]MXZ17630.1 BrxA/BrxB family bacilliredoxin [Rhodothermaceae bacterium]MYC04806.1 BrxA/BrxB family bacilliredoxin [Rhodothermaceae bacterium]MYE63938.1 BrxA/BrxB family bacilliredoxin [Rhodothermaceae bacterium]